MVDGVHQEALTADWPVNMVGTVGLSFFTVVFDADDRSGWLGSGPLHCYVRSAKAGRNGPFFPVSLGSTS